MSGHGRLPWITTLCLLAVQTVPLAHVHAGSAPPSGPAVPVTSLGEPAAAGGYIVRFTTRRALDVALAAEPFGADSTSSRPDRVWTALNGYVAALSSEELSRLQADPNVASVEPDSLLTIDTNQGNPPWGLDRIDQRNLPLNQTYSYGSTGDGVTAYIVDSGIRTTHAEFSGRIVRAAAIDEEGEDGVEDCNGHGTHVAGTLGGSTYGVAKQVSLVPVKVLSCNGTALISTVIDGIEWIITDHAAGVPAVANMSLGGDPSPALDAAVAALIRDGVTVVVAAGNDGYNTCNYSPARLAAAITVGASESDDHIANYSNYGPCNDLFAPGTSVSSAWVTNDTARASLSGTSMATPHVAGAAARLLEEAPWMSPADVWTAVEAAVSVGVLRGTFGGDPNKLLHLVPPPAGPTVPNPPRYLSGMRGDGQVTLSWSPPSTDNGSPIIDYVIRFRTAGTTWTTIDDGVSTGTTTTITGLVNGRCYDFQVAAVNALGTGPVSHQLSITPAARGFTALGPVRLFDTRADQPPGAVAVDKVRLDSRSVLVVKTTDVGGAPASGVAALSLNVTAVDPSGPGFVTVYPCGDRPLASSLNFAGGQIVTNAVITAVSASGEVCFFSSTQTDLIADIDGWFPAASGFTALTPARLFDTRHSEPQGAVTVSRQRYGELRVSVAGTAGMPGIGVAAVSLNVTAVDPAGPGYVTVYPCGEPPLTSNLNYTGHEIVANAVIAPVSPDGEVCFRSSADTDLVVDINGWFSAGSSFTPVIPARVFDTRTTEDQGAVPIAKQQYTELVVEIVGAAGVPEHGVAAVSLNITAVNPTGPGFITVHPCGGRTLTSNLNFTSHRIVPNAVIAPVSAAGEVCFYASTATDLVADINGWYATS